MLSPRRLRRFAACVLLVWLFGLASGIVNACIVSADLGRLDADAVAIEHDHEHGTGAGLQMAGMDHDMAGHEHGGKTPPPCERLCDAPLAVPQADKSLSQALSAFWLAPAPLPAVTVRPAPQLTAALPSDDLRWAATIPIAIEFLRLAL